MLIIGMFVTSGESRRPRQHDAANSIETRQLFSGEASSGRAETADRHRGCTAEPCSAPGRVHSTEFQFGWRKFQEFALLPGIQETRRTEDRCWRLVLVDFVVVLVVESSTRRFRETGRWKAAVWRPG